uniref:Plastid light harvesting protein n=1 Tax=Craspedostauros australis TaxID=1486917 RepID=A0A7R9ZRC2_9STRA|eukprot:CAMPEP_0198109380 /NCGR_PEP_ID=MMETSP1442-20131203/1389_1 /TAXON_ID= /ORGANISM="Craspedostauros australis, Strain CCMP3328" /LENGTH=244 /DNA_ID=CAMNT_0043765013 /DNA_START=124 /DNA_END=858 /DNA_ORIENTATION=+
MKTAILTSLIGAAAAFAPASKSARASVAVQESKADLEVLAKKLNPVVGYFDPWELGDAEIYDYSNEETIGFLRHAEIKHGRVAMAGFVGYIAHANGIKFPWAMEMDGTQFPSETSPPALWDSLSPVARVQIIFFIGFLEVWSEIPSENHKHYMKGGKPGAFPDFRFGDDAIPHPVPFNLYDPFRFNKNMKDDVKERRLLAEINNGRLAMIGLLGFLAEQAVPGSVPLLKGLVPAYDGEVMAPFA